MSAGAAPSARLATDAGQSRLEKRFADLKAADYAACDKSCYLGEEYRRATAFLHTDFHSFIVGHAAVIECHKEFSRMVGQVCHLAAYRKPVDMDIEGGHENADKC